eukprot:m.52528 g.52528  ORF g.52528 m.52528 type:complete len:184 (-) comp12706_c0_seq4:299-850(-)
MSSRLLSVCIAFNLHLHPSHARFTSPLHVGLDPSAAGCLHLDSARRVARCSPTVAASHADRDAQGQSVAEEALQRLPGEHEVHLLMSMTEVHPSSSSSPHVQCTIITPSCPMHHHHHHPLLSMDAQLLVECLLCTRHFVSFLKCFLVFIRSIRRLPRCFAFVLSSCLLQLRSSPALVALMSSC